MSLPKHCVTCGMLTSDYHRDQRAHDGYRGNCKRCQITAVRRSSDPEIASHHRALYRLRHKAEISARDREYRRSRREQLNSAQQRYYLDHRETIIAREVERRRTDRRPGA